MSPSPDSSPRARPNRRSPRARARSARGEAPSARSSPTRDNNAVRTDQVREQHRDGHRGQRLLQTRKPPHRRRDPPEAFHTFLRCPPGSTVNCNISQIGVFTTRRRRFWLSHPPDGQVTVAKARFRPPPSTVTCELTAPSCDTGKKSCRPRDSLSRSGGPSRYSSVWTSLRSNERPQPTAKSRRSSRASLRRRNPNVRCLKS